MDKDRIRKLFPLALSEFNERMGSDLSPELVLVDRKNIVSVFNDLIVRIHAPRDPISSSSYLNGLAAEALAERGTEERQTRSFSGRICRRPIKISIIHFFMNYPTSIV